jgi:hypothetical protein
LTPNPNNSHNFYIHDPSARQKPNHASPVSPRQTRPLIVGNH